MSSMTLATAMFITKEALQKNISLEKRAEAFNTIAKTLNQQAEATVNENILFVKLYILALSNSINHFKCVNLAQNHINRYLCQFTLNNRLNELKDDLNRNEIELFFKELDLMPTWEQGQSLDVIRENVKTNNEIFKKVNISEFESVSETWDIDSVTANLNVTISQIFNNYKNLP